MNSLTFRNNYSQWHTLACSRLALITMLVHRCWMNVGELSTGWHEIKQAQWITGSFQTCMMQSFLDLWMLWNQLSWWFKFSFRELWTWKGRTTSHLLANLFTLKSDMTCVPWFKLAMHRTLRTIEHRFTALFLTLTFNLFRSVLTSVFCSSSAIPVHLGCVSIWKLISLHW